MIRFKNLTLFFTLILCCCFIPLSATIVQDENFNAGAMPAGWTAVANTGDTNWQFDAIGFYTCTGAGFASPSGDASAYAFFDDDCPGQNAPVANVTLTSPATDVSAAGQVTLTFDYRHTRGLIAGMFESFAVEVFDGTSWVLVLSDTPLVDQNTNGNPFTVDVTAQKNPNFQVRFTYDDGGQDPVGGNPLDPNTWGGGFGIDNFLLESFATPGSITNDDCQDAIPLTCGTSVSGTTVGAQPDIAGSPCPGDLFVNTGLVGVWYKYVGNGQDLTLTTCNAGTDFDAQIRVFNALVGNDCTTGLTCVIGNDDNAECVSDGLQASVTLPTSTGTDYFVYVGGFATNEGNFQLDVSCVDPVTPPDNDDCQNALPLTCGTPVTGSTLDATVDLNLGTPCTGDITVNTGVTGVWYQYAGDDQVLNLTTCNSGTDFDAQIRVYTANLGNDCTTGLSCVVGNDDDAECASDGLQASVSVPTEAGVTYFVYIGGFATNAGNFQLDVTCSPRPTNDDCEDAEAITCGQTLTGTTAGATSDIGLNGVSAICANGDNNTNTSTTGVFYSFTGTGQNVTVSTCSPNTMTDTQIRVLTGSCTNLLDPLTCVSGNDDIFTCPSGGTQSIVNFDSQAGTEYFFYVAQSGPSQGGDLGGVFDISVTCQDNPINDDCADALPIVCGDVLSGTTTGAMTDVGLAGATAACADDPTSNTNNSVFGVFYSYTGTGDIVTVTTCSPNTFTDTQMRVVTGDCTNALDPLVCVTGNDDDATCTDGTFMSTATFTSVVGEEYLIYISAAGAINGADAGGDFELSMTCVPNIVNDDCDGALPLVCGTPTMGTTIGATEDLNLGTPCTGDITVNTGVTGVWYTYTPTTNEVLNLSTCNAVTDFDVQLRVYTNPLGLDCNLPGSLQCVVGNDDIGAACTETPTEGLNAAVSVPVDAGVQYYIYVGIFSINPPGNFQLDVECTPRPTNDDCGDAITVACGDVVTGTTAGATSDLAISTVAAACANGDNNTNISSIGVFYEFIGTGDNVTVSTCSPNTTSDTQIRVATGGCALPVCVTGNDDIFTCPSGGTQSIANFDSDLGVSYLIFVSHLSETLGGDSGGPFELSITCQDNPVNDDCANALPIVCGDVLSGTTTGAMTDVGLAGATAACADDPLSNTNNSVFGVFYSYIGTGDIVTVTTCSPNTFTDTQMRVVTGDCTDPLDPLVCVTGNDDDATCADGTFMSTATFTSTAGEEYLIYISAAGAINGADAGGDFELSMTCVPAAPINDDCADAIPISCGDVVTGDTENANLDNSVNAATAACLETDLTSAGVEGVFYSFIGTGELVTITTCSPNTVTDTQIRVATGSCDGVAEPILCVTGNDDDAGCAANGLASTVSFGSIVGEEYLIYVSKLPFPLGDGGGVFELSITCEPIANNDDCTGAIPITCGSMTTGTTTNATLDVLPATPCGDLLSNVGATGVWYQFMGDGQIWNLSTCNEVGNFDTQIRVFTPLVGSDCTTGMTCVAGNDQDAECANSGDLSTTEFESTIGEMYFVFVGGFLLETGDFRLDVECRPAPEENDECVDATQITCGNTLSGTTVGATADLITVTCADPVFVSVFPTGVWYTYQGTGALVNLTLCEEPDFDARMTVLTGDCTAPVCLETSNQFTNCTEGQEEISFMSIAGIEYFIFISNQNGTEGAFTVNLECIDPPANDECADATPITCDDVLTGNTIAATPDNAINAATAACVGLDLTNAGITGVFYTYMGTGDVVTLTTCSPNTETDTQVRVLTGSCDDPANPFLCVASDDDDANCADSGTASTVSFVSEMNTVYTIFVSRLEEPLGDGGGQFEIAMTCVSPPTNDDCGDAIAIDCGETVTGTTTASTVDLQLASPTTFCINGDTGDETSGEGVWYVYNSGIEAMEVTVSTCNPGTESDNDTQVRVFTSLANCAVDLICVEGNNDADPACPSNALASTLSYNSIPNTTYYIFVGRPYDPTGLLGVNDGGVFELSVECTPITNNDVCTNATNIACGETLTGSTAEATVDLQLANPTTFCVNGDTGDEMSGEGVWYTYVEGVLGQEITVSTCNPGTDPNNDTQVRVFTSLTGDCTIDLICVEGNETADPVCASNGLASTVVYNSIPNTTYYIFVGRPYDPTGLLGLNPGGDFELSIDCAPITNNDVCTNALPIACGENLMGSTSEATVDLQLAVATAFCVNGDTGDEMSGEGVWYTYTGTGEDVIVSTCNPGTDPNNDTQIRVFTSITGNCETDLLCVEGNDNADPACADNALASTLQFSSQLNQDYFIFVGRPYDPTGLLGVNPGGDFELSIECVPPADNDNCMNATPIACGESIMGSTEDATVDLQLAVPTAFCVNGDTGDEMSGEGVWYTLLGTGQQVNLTTCNAGTDPNNDTQIRVFTSPTGNCDIDLICVEGNDNDATCAANALASTVDFVAELNTTYYVFIGRPYDPTGLLGVNPGGAFELSMTCTDIANNDDCTNAIPVTCNTIVSGNTAEATVDLQLAAPTSFCVNGDIGDETGGIGLWYTFLGTGEIVNFSTCSDLDGVNTPADNDTQIRVFTSTLGMCDVPGDLMCVDANDNDPACGNGMQSSVDITTTAGELYYIFVARQFPISTGGPFDLAITAPAQYLTCPTDITVNNDAGVCGAVVDYTVLGREDCMDTTGDLITGLASGGLFPAGTTPVTYQITDSFGAMATCSFNVTVNDTEPPVAICQDVTVILQPDGTATVAPTQVNNNSTDNCGVTMLALDQTTFTGEGTFGVVLTVTDAAGNTNTCSDAVVTVMSVNNDPPVAVCMDITVALDANGMATIQGSDIDGGSTPAGVALSVDMTDFTCDNLGANTVTLTATNAGMDDMCTATVTITDETAPTAVCQDITVQVSGGSPTTITGADVDNGSTDNCMITSSTVSPNSFTCADIGTTTTTLTVMDAAGLSAQCTANVTIEESNDLMAVCQDITVELDANGMVSITATEVDGGSTGGCAATLMVSQTDFTCDDIGNNVVTLTVTSGGNSDQCNATVSVVNNMQPTPMCQDITVQLDANGMVSITAADVDNGSTANCPTTLSIDNDMFDCSNVGANTVTLTVVSGANNSASCTATVTVEDMVAPMAVCQDITIQVNNGSSTTIAAADVDNGSSDNCSVVLSLDNDTFDCSNVGANTVMLTATDPSGNTDMCTATVTVEEDAATLMAVCQDITIELDTDGMATIVAADIDGGSTGGCNAMLSASQTMFDCTNIGANTVTLTVTSGGSSDMCDATVTVENNVMPTAMCKELTVQLGANDMVTIVAADIDDGSTANCPFTISIDEDTFDCSNVGMPNNTVTLSVTSGTNTALCTTNVVVEETTPPMAVCQDITVQVGASGSVTIQASEVDNGSSDNCAAVLTLALDNDTFTCDDIGANTVTLTASDNSGNMDMCTATVTVEENTMLMAVCQNIDVQLQADGTAMIEASDVDNGSGGGCNAMLSIDVNSFTCADIGDNDVVLTLSEGANSDMCTAIVTIEDAPIMAVCQNITVGLGADGTAMITATNVDGGSTTGCDGMLSIDVNTFTCDDLGDNDVVLTVTSTSGNTSMCTAVVTVEEGGNVEAVCQDATVSLDANGMGSVTTADIDGGSSLGCGGSLSVTPTSFTCADLGDNTVTLTVTTDAGATDECMATVTVTDTNPPVAICQDISIVIDEGMTLDIDPSEIDNGSTVSCGDVNLSLSQTTFSCDDFGDVNPVTLTVTSDNGMTTTCEANVSVGCNPICPITDFICRQPTVTTTDPGTCEKDNFIMKFPFVITEDNCVTDNFEITSDLVLPASVGTHLVVFQLNAPFGQSMACLTSLIIEDHEAPVFDCPSHSITRDAGDECTIMTQFLPSVTATDNCTDVVVTSDAPSTLAIGTHEVTYTATDEYGNTSTCTRTVLVRDNIAPTFISCPSNITAEIDGEGCSTDVSWNTPTATDNCGTAEVFGSVTPGSSFDIGVSQVSYTAIDTDGNEAECSFSVTVLNNQNIVFENCPDDMTIVSDNGGSVEVNWMVPTATAGDCPVNLTTNVQPGDNFPLGETQVTYTYGGVSCSFVITVIQGADLVCPQNFRVTIPEGQDSILIEWNLPYGETVCDLVPDTIDEAVFDYLGNFEGHDYYICSANEVLWTSAVAIAEFHGGELVKIESAEENYFLQNEMAPFTSAWIGLEDNSSEGTFHWIDDDTLTYTNWAVGAPNIQSTHIDSLQDTNDYVLMNADGTWDDANTFAQHYFIMEVPTYEMEQIYPLGYDTFPNITYFYPGEHPIFYEMTDACGNTDVCHFNVYVFDEEEIDEPFLYHCNVETQDTTDNHFIQRVEIGDFVSDSGDNDGTLFEYNDHIAFEQGDTISMYMEADTLYPNDYLYWRVWIDYNWDSDYYDEGEMVFEAEGINDTLIDIITPLMPIEDSLYDVRPSIRVMLSTTDYPDPCGYLQNGEAENYRFRYLNPDLLIEEEADPNPPVSGFIMPISPNPTAGFVTVGLEEMAGLSGILEVKDLTGRNVFTRIFSNMTEEAVQLNLEHLPSGVYFLTMQLETEVITKQLYIERRP